MPRKYTLNGIEVELDKVTLNIIRGDKEVLESFFPAKGWSVAVRELIHNICERLRESDSQEVLSNSNPLDIEIPLEDLDIGGKDAQKQSN